jgi:hypothetical protein
MDTPDSWAEKADKGADAKSKLYAVERDEAVGAAFASIALSRGGFMLRRSSNVKACMLRDGPRAPKRRMRRVVRARNVRKTHDVIAKRHEDCGNPRASRLPQPPHIDRRAARPPDTPLIHCTTT